MKAKKSQIAFMLVGLLVVGGVSFLLGRQSAPTTAAPPIESTAPVESNGVDIKTESLDTVEEFLVGDELTALFQQVYDLVIEQEIPQEYRLQTELLYLPDLNTTGKALPVDYEAQYLDWRPEDEAAETEPTVPIENQTPEEPEVQQNSSHPAPQNPSTSNNKAENNTSASGLQSYNDGPNAHLDQNGDGLPDIFWESNIPDKPSYDDEHREEWGEWRRTATDWRWVWNTESLIDPESPNYNPRSNPSSPNYEEMWDPRQEPSLDPGEGYRWKWYWDDDYKGGHWSLYKPGNITIN